MPEHVREGVTINYEVHGKGPAIMFIHGVGSRLEAWDYVIRELYDGYTCIRYDLRGFGRSTKVPGPYDMGMFLGDFTTLQDQLGIERCHVVGFSLGGLIAQALAVTHPDRVDRLVLCSTGAGQTPEMRNYLLQRGEQIRNTAPGEHFRKSLDGYYTKEFQRDYPERIAMWQAFQSLNDPETFAAAYRLLAEYDYADRLSTVPNKTLFVTGENDGGQKVADFFGARIADLQSVILPRLRHSILTEAPETVGKTIRAFLDC